jgi:hypothetical protein
MEGDSSCKFALRIIEQTKSKILIINDLYRVNIKIQ